jgi:hypothetical protein
MNCILAAAAARLLRAVAPAPEAVSISAGGATIEQGGTASITVSISRTNYSGAVTMSVTGLPSGATPSWDFETRAGANDTSRVLTITTSPSATVGAAGLTITATPAGKSGVTAGVTLTVTAPEAGYTSVAASLTRYDAADGSALFRGAIPFAPGVITTTAALDNVRVLVGGSEPASGLWIEALEARHSDDSIKSAYVEFTASCDSDESVACEVRIGQARTNADLGAVTNAVDRAPRAWQAAPTLFAITDAAYLCASRIAPMPLVPLSHPNLPASVVTWLTTEFDVWNASTSTSGNAQYDEQYPLICRYLCTGNPAFLAEACERNQSENTPTVRTRLPWSYYVADGTVTWNGVDLNPANYPKMTGDPNGAGSEPWNTALSALMIYQLTGWEYGRLHIERDAVAGRYSDFRVTTSQLSAWSLNGTTFGYPRQAYRWQMQGGVLAHTLRMNRYVDIGGGLAFKAPTDPHGTASLTIKQRVELVFDRLLAYNATVEAGVDGVPAWWPELWAVGKSNSIDSPNFQFVTLNVPWMAYLNGADTRASIPTQIDAVADFVQDQMVLNGSFWCINYGVTDPGALGTPNNGTFATVLAWLMAWKYARTGDTTARDRYDALSRQANVIYAAPSGAEAVTRKIGGEMFYMAYHGAALRAGVNPLTWEEA